ncbi:hypothetical protein ACER0A_014030 [Haloimpatiens sp. FM7315]
MAKNQNKTNKKISDNIKNSLKESRESETSVSGFKSQDLNANKKNLRK